MSDGIGEKIAHISENVNANVNIGLVVIATE